jgi:hypothetical protein
VELICGLGVMIVLAAFIAGFIAYCVTGRTLLRAPRESRLFFLIRRVCELHRPRDETSDPATF